MEQITSLARETYDMTIMGINMGFALAVALAWNEAVKQIIKKSIRLNTDSRYYYFMYAIMVTILAVLVFFITQTFLKKDMERPRVIYAAT